MVNVSVVARIESMFAEETVAPPEATALERIVAFSGRATVQ